MQVKKYLATRFTTLIPPLIVPENPIKLLRMLNRQQTAFFLVALLAWTWDAFDFFSVSLNIIEIADTYGRSTADVTWGITVTLMLRSVGSILFGIAGDRFGRKWPFIVNIVFYSIVEVATGFCTTFTQFIGVRALLGIAMGGIYGNSAATALEDAPIAARGLLSGLLQQGYALGYLLAAAFNLAITDNQPYGWRALFWFGGGPPLLIALWRIFLPETQAFLRMRDARAAEATDEAHQQIPAVRTFADAVPAILAVMRRFIAAIRRFIPAVRAFLATVRFTLVHHWPTLIYLVLMMAGFNFLSHGSQDLYPTFLASQLQFSHGLVTATTVVANCGALVGGSLVGYFSSFFGRRLSIIVVLIAGGALIPAYVLPRGTTIMAGAFFQQFCVQGAWGVIPIHLIELSPVEFRSFVVGTSYQLGNLISAASSTIEATAGQHFPLQTSSTSPGKHQFDYGKVMAIFLACTYTYLLIIMFLGPEKTNVDEINANDDQNKTDHPMQPSSSSSSVKPGEKTPRRELF